MEFTEKIKELRKKRSDISKLNSELIQFSSGIFEEFYKYIFDKYSKLESFGWTQYTPYFNDGDSCVFSAQVGYISINGDFVEESNWINPNTVLDWGTWNSEKKVYEGRVECINEDYDGDLVEVHDEIVDFLGNFDDDFYMRKFGDHAEVMVTRSGVDISDYDHD